MVGRDEDRRRGKVLRFTALRREHYLEVFGQTGNKRAAAEAIGFRTNRIAAIRRRDAGFDADCRAAEATATDRLKDVEGQFEGLEDDEFSTIRRCRDGRVQIIAVGPGRWSRRVEERFFAILCRCGNIEASARAVGFSGTDIFRRRRQWPAFAHRFHDVLDEAEIRLEHRLAAWGNNVPMAGGGETEAAAEGAGDVVPVDPDFALRFLKWREEKRRGRSAVGRNGRLSARARAIEDMPIEEVRAEVLRRVAAIRRHRDQGEDAG